MEIRSGHVTYWTERVLGKFQKVHHNKWKRKMSSKLLRSQKFLVDCEILFSRYNSDHKILLSTMLLGSSISLVICLLAGHTNSIAFSGKACRRN